MLRDLSSNSSKIQDRLRKLDDFAERELIRNYADALDDVRATLSRLYEQFTVEGELTRAEAARFLRLSNLEEEIAAAARPYLQRNEELLRELAQVGFDRGFYENAWAVDQAVGVRQQWGQINPEAVRAAVGLSDNYAALGGIISEQQARRHRRVLQDAFAAYEDDTRRWIGREITQGVIKGESASKVAKRIDQNAFVHSRNSAMTIARTETLRASGIGSQVAYDQAADKGVRVRQIWDATLDNRTRPDHAQADGTVRDEETGLFSVPWGTVPGPRQSGIAAQDINCRCDVRPEIEGYAPEVRRIRGEGLQPYQTFTEWARRQGIQANRFGQKYSFLDG